MSEELDRWKFVAGDKTITAMPTYSCGPGGAWAILMIESATGASFYYLTGGSDARLLSNAMRDVWGAARSEGEAAGRQRALILDEPWSVPEFVAKLAQGVRHLLEVHDCDEHGWEEFKAALDAADAFHARLASSPAPTPATGMRWTREAPTVAGHYWTRMGPGYSVSVCDVHQHGSALRRWKITNDGGGEWMPVTADPNREWAGPLHEPEEPTR